MATPVSSGSGSKAAAPSPPPLRPVASVQELVAAREAAGMSRGDILGLLKMAPRQIDALEAGDWAALPGLSFVRGALRSYGRVVGVSVDPLLESLVDEKAAELRASTSLKEPLPSKSMLGFGSGGSGSKTAWLLLGAVLLIALALFFGRDTDFSRIPSLLQRGADVVPGAPAASGEGAGGTTVESVSISPSGAASAPAPAGSSPSASAGASGSPAAAKGGPESVATASAAAASGAASPASPAGSPPVTAGSGASGATPGPTGASAGAAASSPAAGISAAAPASAVPAGAEGLRLSFERESWVEVKQADGKVLLYGQQKPGTQTQLPLSAEVSLTIGNAEFVRLERHGQPVDLKAISRQGVARLKLAP